MVEKTLVVRHPHGLHARPAADFYRACREFQSRVTIQNLSRPESPEVAVSLFNILQIGVSQGHEVRVRASGVDECAALQALSAVIEQHTGGE
jgi:phosphocarrier protein HPr